MAGLKRRLLYGLVAHGILIQPAMAATKPSPFLILGGKAEAPRGYLAMCAQAPTECDGDRPQSASPDAVGDGASADASIGATGAIVAAHRILPSPALIAPAHAAAPTPAATPVGAWQSMFSARVHDATLDDRFGQFTLTFVSRVAPSTFAAFIYAVEPTPAVAPALQRAATTIAPPISVPAPSASPPVDEQQLLKRINVRVNRIVRQATDLSIYGREEVWHASGAYEGAAGDCEDMALEKQAELIAAGFPKSQLSLAVVYAPAVGLHTVLVARTRDGDQVLDSRSPYLRPWHKSGYTWLSVQAFAETKSWRQPLSERQIALAASEPTEAGRS